MIGSSSLGTKEKQVCRRLCAESVNITREGFKLIVPGPVPTWWGGSGKCDWELPRVGAGPCPLGACQGAELWARFVYRVHLKRKERLA